MIAAAGCVANVVYDGEPRGASPGAGVLLPRQGVGSPRALEVVVQFLSYRAFSVIRGVVVQVYVGREIPAAWCYCGGSGLRPRVQQ